MATDTPVTLTIGKLANYAGVGVETIRVSSASRSAAGARFAGTYPHYPLAIGSRIRFIKRAQELGFSLTEISGLIELEDDDRASIRRIASERLAQVQSKLTEPERMKSALSHLIDECEHTGQKQRCPIIATLSGNNGPA